MKNILFTLLVIIFFGSCEKNVNFPLKNSDDVLVVDAQIENGQPPRVVLTKSLNYFGQISPEILAASFIHNASITVSNGTLTHTLKEYTVPLTGQYVAYYYGIDSSSLSTAFMGEFNKRYSLTINAGGKQYSASTTIPLLVKYPDSLWFKVAPQNPDTTKRVLMGRITDPPGLGNYVRYFTKVNSGRFLPALNSVFNDEFVDGTTYTAQADPGIDRNNPPANGENFFHKGDTVTFKLSNIDKDTYTFWSTWEFNQQSVGNPFSQPGKVTGNISNGALGAFCGYASWYGTVIAR
ncbi:MAG: DUF4249 domain-containing protein [Ferruginibacter sp.]